MALGVRISRHPGIPNLKYLILTLNPAALPSLPAHPGRKPFPFRIPETPLAEVNNIRTTPAQRKREKMKKKEMKKKVKKKKRGVILFASGQLSGA